MQRALTWPAGATEAYSAGCFLPRRTREGRATEGRSEALAREGWAGEHTGAATRDTPLGKSLASPLTALKGSRPTLPSGCREPHEKSFNAPLQHDLFK